ncbi:tetratricopeptide repeat protein 36 [Homalodisca vitripennis]|uniref:tetratricopeptide repeat protein 36 n=1 Tax=Homalodisca vitripennis TaxID=197043 RepID=UPI001EECB046|nr:tetratricopeptide repeat protein 36 [Homalodisca vitripennis]KAG8284028.1 Tetratricopeptide repeat protein 36 [Homalodisca vitripennis]
MSSDHDKAVLDSIFNPYLPLGEGVNFQETKQEYETEEDDSESTKEAKALELEGVRKAEAGELKTALQLLTQALELAPGRPSTLNNRAQVYRLAADDSAALEDLTRAISLSEGRTRVAAQALCQRALIYRRRGDDSAARDDFQAAASLGSDFAKQQLVQMNPYAAMCNQMLRQVFTKLQSPSESA